MKWERKGECNHCGHCCQIVTRQPIVRTEQQIEKDPAFYHVRGFQKQEIDGEEVYVLWAWLTAPCPQHVVEPDFGLGKLQRCAVYDARPETCRTFPRVPGDVVGTPCSYWFEREAPLSGSESERYKMRRVLRAGGTGSPHPVTEARLLNMERGD